MYQLIIVEDEAKIRNGIVNLFPWTNIGFEVVGSFSDGQQALAYLAQNPVDVVLTDIRMPNMGGVELAKRIAESKLPVIVVFLSAFQDFDYLHQAILNGVKDYLVKPVKYDELIECFSRIKDHLDQQSASQEVPQEDLSYYQQVVQNVKNYIADHLQSATLEEAALQVNLSANYLSRIFKERTGVSFSDCLLEARMGKAAELMRGIDHKLYEISHIVGYASPKNFSRAFKNYYHMTPKEYRALEGNNRP